MPTTKRVPIPPVIDPAQRYSLPEVAAILRLGIAQVYRDIKAGRLKTFKDGRRTYAAGVELLRRSRPPKTATRQGKSPQPAAP